MTGERCERGLYKIYGSTGTVGWLYSYGACDLTIPTASLQMRDPFEQSDLMMGLYD